MRAWISLISLFVLVFSSCTLNGNTKRDLSVNEKIKKESIDTFGAEQVKQKSIQEGFRQNYHFPIVFDGKYFEKDDSLSPISMQELRILCASYHPHQIFERYKYVLREHFRFNRDTLAADDSLYLFERGPLTPSESDASKLFFNKLSDSTMLLFWSIRSGQRDVCPYFYGHHILMTVFVNGKIGQTICVASKSYGGDPPVEGRTNRFARIDEKGRIDINQEYIIDDDTEDPYYDLTKDRYRLMISNDSFTIKKIEIGSSKRKRQ